MAFSYSTVVSDPGNLGGSLDAIMATDLQAALADWSKYLDGLGTLVVNLVVEHTLRANGGATSEVIEGTTASGATLVEASSTYELTTGRHASGTTSDITINIDPDYAKTLFLNPSPGNGAAIPANETDAVSVFRHELGHGFGIAGYYDATGNAAYGTGAGGYLTDFDTLIQRNTDGTAYFTGAAAEAVAGGPVQLTTNSTTENYYHLANSVNGPDGQDLMNGQAFDYGKSYQISSLDLAMLKDIGNPVTATNPSAAIVALHGRHDQYAIAPQQDCTLLIQDQVAGRDGTIDASSLTALAFSDGKGIGDTSGIAEDVDRLYQAAFNRPADLAGVQSWTDAIHAGQVTLGGVAEAFTQTPEFASVDGALNDSGYVQVLYEHVLGHAGDAGGIAFWTGALASGMDRGQALASFASSTENLARTLPVDGSRNAAETTRLYQAAFNRQPDAGGAQFWTGALNNGATPLSVAQQLVASPEFAAAYAGTTSPAYVGQLFSNILHRPGDPSGVQFWNHGLDSGATRAQVLTGFADSNENRVGTAASTHDGWAFLG
jgi:hypothetical protein